MITSTAIVSLLGSWAAGHLVSLIATQGTLAFQQHRQDRMQKLKLRWLEENKPTADQDVPAQRPGRFS